MADTLHNIAGLAQNLAGSIGSNLESCRKQTGNTKERTSLWPRDSFIAATVHNDYRCRRTRGSIMHSRERSMSYVTMLCSKDIHIICKTRKFQSRGKIGRQAWRGPRASSVSKRYNLTSQTGSQAGESCWQQISVSEGIFFGFPLVYAEKKNPYVAWSKCLLAWFYSLFANTLLHDVIRLHAASVRWNSLKYDPS